MTATLTCNKWKVFPEQKQIAQELSQALSISTFVAQLLVNRGVTSSQSARCFIHPALTDIQIPTKDQGANQAVDLLWEAVVGKKKILISGDYDVDGITSIALLILALKELGITSEYYIPHRSNDGYGLNDEVIERCRLRDIYLMITVDCGISNIQEIALARKYGIKTLITDHHNLPAELPSADAIFHPQLFQTGFPYLAGVGVAYKLVEMLYRKYRPDLDCTPYLDLVALGTVADMVPLVAENRILTTFGLHQISRNQRMGIQMLSQVAGLNPPISTRDIGFALAPRLNSAGRLKEAGIGVELLLSSDARRTRQLADELDQLNIQRQRTGKLIKNEADEMFRSGQTESDKVLLLSSTNWHPGVIGIVATQLAQQYQRPTILIAVKEGIGRGSVRSFADLDIYAPLQQCRAYFTEFGGHRAAAGFEICTTDIDAFRKHFLALMDVYVKPEDLNLIQRIDLELELGDINDSLLNQLNVLEPFGESNPRPVLLIRGLYPISHRLVGGGAHLKVTFADSTGRIKLEAIGFNFAHKIPFLQQGSVDVVGTVGYNEWDGKRVIQLTIQDMEQSIIK